MADRRDGLEVFTGCAAAAVKQQKPERAVIDRRA
jgi:hypothetical protein